MKNNTVLTALQRRQTFLRGIAAIVLVTFTCLIMESTAVAARVAIEEQQTTTHSKAAHSGDERKFTAAIQNIEATLNKLQSQLDQGKSGKKEKKELKTLKKTIKKLNKTVTRNFKIIAKDLKKKGLSKTILQRHTDMVNNYRNELATLLSNLDNVEHAKDKKDRKKALTQAKKHLESKKHQRAHQHNDPHDLGHKSHKSDHKNKPKQSKKEFTQAGLFDTPYTQLAAHGNFTFDQLPMASDPAYLASTPEISLSAVIQDQATALNHDPVKIYHWVRNNIEWLPSWGAMQAADLTLSSQRGNSMDIASLTIALLRASGIPSRYVHGTIEINKDQFINWTGDFASIEAAQEFASVGGIPTTSVISGGQVTKMRIEHLWVEAAIDYLPSRAVGYKWIRATNNMNISKVWMRSPCQDSIPNSSLWISPTVVPLTRQKAGSPALIPPFYKTPRPRHKPHWKTTSPTT